MSKQQEKTVVIFTINGINSLIGWNAVLAALDYFQYKFKDFNIPSFLPIPLFLGYIIIGLTFHRMSNQFRYITLIVSGNIIVNIALAGLLLVSITLEQTPLGFYLLLGCSFSIGIGMNINEITQYAMINYLSSEVVAKYTIGTAISGVAITIIRVIILAIAGSDNNSYVPATIYFFIAICFNIVTIGLNIVFCRSDVYRDKIDAFMIHHDKQFLSDQMEVPADQIVKCRNESITDDYLREKQRVEQQSYLVTLKETFLDIFPFPLLLIANYIITFTLFPGPSLAKHFERMSISWSAVTLLLAYNLGDMAGKFLGDVNDIFNKQSLLFTLFCRLTFFFPIILMATGGDFDDPLLDNLFFPFLNQFLFGLTNGFVTNCTFIIAFRQSSLIYKKYAGVFCGLSLQLGIILGTILEVPFAYSIGLIS